MPGLPGLPGVRATAATRRPGDFPHGGDKFTGAAASGGEGTRRGNSDVGGRLVEHPPAAKPKDDEVEPLAEILPSNPDALVEPT